MGEPPDRKEHRNQGNKVETKEDSPEDNRFLCQHQVRWKEKLVQRCELVDSQF